MIDKSYKIKLLRKINGFKLNTSPEIEAMNNMSGLLSLRQRQEKQLLLLMLWYSQFNRNLLKKDRRTRLQEKLNFKVLPLKTRRYINSPMNLGNIFWNKLRKEQQYTFSNQMFKLILEKNYKVYKA